jgi:hypothetical protein
MMGMPDHAVQAFPTMPVYDDVFTQQHTPSESARRISRSSCSGYKPNNSMRIVKPSSASNSPQTMAQRRRTMMNDGNLARRRQYALDQAILQQQLQNAAAASTPATFDTYQEPVKRSTRPMSWHPSTQMQQQPFQMQIQQMPQFDASQYILPNTTPSDMDFYSGYQQFPPTPAIYSGHTSPVSTFSPLSLPFAASTQHQMSLQPQMDTCSWDTNSYMNAVPMSTSGSPGTTEAFPAFSTQSAMEWDAFATNGFNTCTAPPTPETYQQVDQAEPILPAEESIPYQALDEPEEEGEILVGMGLYDEKTDEDPELDHYRTSTSDLLGSTYRKGAGLKLEEAWEPPKEDDESSNEDEDEEEEDAEEE